MKPASRRGRRVRHVIHADFFVLRAPVLPLDTLGARSGVGIGAAGLGTSNAQVAESLEAHRRRVRTGLSDLAARPDVRQALELSSLELVDAIDRWSVDPGHAKSRSAERSLVRHITRMASRPTLFGVSAAYALGRFDGRADLELGPRSNVRSVARVAPGLLHSAVRQALADACDARGTDVRTNPAAYRVAGRIRVAARHPLGNRYRLVAVRSSDAVESALRIAADGCSLTALLSGLRADGNSEAQASDVVTRLLASDLLVPALGVATTGDEAAAQALDTLSALPTAASLRDAVLRSIELVAASDRPGADVITAVRTAFGESGAQADGKRCIQVDAAWPRMARLPRGVLAQVQRAVELLARIAPPEPDRLAPFREAFSRRFQTRSVPLLEALDPDFGVRVDGPARAPDPWPRGQAERELALLDLIERGRRSSTNEVELAEDDIEALSVAPRDALRGAFAVVASLEARAGDAIDAGDFRLLEPVVTGPSGACLLGRLCHGDPELERLVRDHLRDEAALDPEAIFAELTLVPETMWGLNVTHRPRLREWEIEYAGSSGAPDEHRLGPSDLMVSVENDEVVLRSVRLGRRVVPCMTSQLNTDWISLPAGRFLAMLVHQHAGTGLGWSWDGFSESPALPRITKDRVVLALRRWNVSARDISVIGAGTDAQGFSRLQEWRTTVALPRIVTFHHPREKIVIDFENVLSVEAFLASLSGVRVLRFTEAPTPQTSPVTGPDGAYAHDIITPIVVGTRPVPELPQAPRAAAVGVAEARRRFAPGSEWLFAKLYGPPGLADRVLIEIVGPLVAGLRERGALDGWFFIRYRDPDPHLRVRFHGLPRDLIPDVLDATNRAVAGALADGRLHRIAFDTYEREIERYGGLEGVELMERVAEADSDAVISILAGRVRAADRRRLTAAGLAGLYASSGLDLERCQRCCTRLRDTWSGGSDRSLGALLGAAEREERPRLIELIADVDGQDGAQEIEALRRHRHLLAPVLRDLSDLDARGGLERSFDDVMCSLAHMFANRVLPLGETGDELRAHDALARIYEARLARARAESRRHDRPAQAVRSQ
jgi:lantibiotic biosynthesis protein